MQPFEYPETTVVRWVDGDTVELLVAKTTDFGFGIHPRTEYEPPTGFRLCWLDTPERGKPGYKEATAEMMRLAPPGTTVTAYTYKRNGVDPGTDPEKYGRYLVDVHVNGQSLNQHLLRGGFAVPYTGGAKA